MSLHWLKLNKPCVLEIPQCTDYAGQRLIFRPRQLTRRCVTDETLANPLVQKYIALTYIVLDGTNAGVAAPPAAPVVKKAPPVVEEVAPAPEPEPEPAPEPEPEPEPEPVPEPEPAPEPEPEPEAVSDTLDTPEPESEVTPEEASTDTPSTTSGTTKKRRKRRKSN